MSDEYLAEPKPPLSFSIPETASTVTVRVIDTGTLLKINPKLFWQPPLQGFDGVHAPIYCFLISHNDRHVLFDLGLRADWKTYAPKIVSLIANTTEVTQGPDIATILNTDASGLNIRSKDIEAVIWSHNHFDHTGDPATFPPSTELVVGPGVKAASWPGYPSKDDGVVLDSDAVGRNVREVNFDQGLRIGRFDAYDFFGDGSFYLLDAPGHAVGHLCGLARTTSGPSSFIFMGADAAHHPGVIRPTEYLPLPRSVSMKTGVTPQTQPRDAHANGHSNGHAGGLWDGRRGIPNGEFDGHLLPVNGRGNGVHLQSNGVIDATDPRANGNTDEHARGDANGGAYANTSGGTNASVKGSTNVSTTSTGHTNGITSCPGELLEQMIRDRNPTSSFFTVEGAPLFPEQAAGIDTVAKIQELDARDDIFVLIAHDLSVRERIPLFPEKINAWKAEGLGVSTRWLFCRDFEGSLSGSRVD